MFVWSVVTDGPGGCVDNQEIPANLVTLDLIDESERGFRGTILASNEGDPMKDDARVSLLGDKMCTRAEWCSEH